MKVLEDPEDRPKLEAKYANESKWQLDTAQAANSGIFL